MLLICYLLFICVAIWSWNASVCLFLNWILSIGFTVYQKPKKAHNSDNCLYGISKWKKCLITSSIVEMRGKLCYMDEENITTLFLHNALKINKWHKASIILVGTVECVPQVHHNSKYTRNYHLLTHHFLPLLTHSSKIPSLIPWQWTQALSLRSTLSSAEPISFHFLACQGFFAASRFLVYSQPPTNFL